MARLDPAIWQNRRVLVTGHTGFKGSWLCQILEMMGAQVFGYSLPPDTDPNHFASLSWTRLESCLGDIRDVANLESFVKQTKPEIILHLAAQPLVLRSYLDPRYTYETNVMGTLNLLEAVRNTPAVRAVVIVTSDKCYENRETNHPYHESDAMGGFDPYSSSKGCAEILTSSYRQSFFNLNEYGQKHNLLLASARAGNVLGGGDWSNNRLIPDFARAFRDRTKVTLRSPNAIRPWQHVLEPLYGYLMLAEKLFSGNKAAAEAWNFGPAIDECWTVAQIVNEARNIWPGFEYEIVPSSQHEAKNLILDSTKARTRLKWTPMFGVQQTLAWSLEWYRDFITAQKVNTRSQIERYLSLHS